MKLRVRTVNPTIQIRPQFMTFQSMGIMKRFMMIWESEPWLCCRVRPQPPRGGGGCEVSQNVKGSMRGGGGERGV